MKLLALCTWTLVFLAVFPTCQGALHRESVKADPAHPGKCVKDGKAYSLGSSWDVEGGECQRGSCSQLEQPDFVITYATCFFGSQFNQDPTLICGFTLDEEAGYPHCCPDYKCTKIRGAEAIPANQLLTKLPFFEEIKATDRYEDKKRLDMFELRKNYIRRQ